MGQSPSRASLVMAVQPPLKADTYAHHRKHTQILRNTSQYVHKRAGVADTNIKEKQGSRLIRASFFAPEQRDYMIKRESEAAFVRVTKDGRCL